MKNNIFKKLAFSSMLCGSLLVAGNVKIATDGTGDFLTAPFYEAKNDVCSELKVFNTNESSSILAKVSIREQISSQEVDFPIFLSPGDVWAGTICEEGEGRVVLRSIDDSNHPSIAEVLASGKDLNAHSRNAKHLENIDFSRGYVEIYPIAQFDEGSTNKVQKPVLHKRWEQLTNGNSSDSKLRKSGVDEDSLSGVISFVTEQRETASIAMVAFENTHSKQRTGTSIAYSEDTSPELLLGQSEKVQILKLLQNSTTSFVYDNFGQDQYVYLTFPFGYTADQQREVKVIVRDMSENKDTPKELIFSPRPASNKYVINNELVVIPVSELIATTQNSSNYEKGMIQLKGIKNVSNHQLGAGETASFIPSVVSTMTGSSTFINTVVKAAVK
ncbi:hypothetical protein GCM10012288_00670 [Malaciobacter pacificus]|uniref:Uncharacterized protein n=1 Tax=Malaciobacter pacificus TaxID=1080223 RepID=A0A5C2H7X9_9BACT|nr:hypothetical protein [Malaciobacter pacificus]QEP33326.1 hypothetical protein APAC_0156 [Malaciobacter pacificus]GGD30471.1 hypothetical protein GCM10012288_00670 [Malaciobacter pacificus]